MNKSIYKLLVVFIAITLLVSIPRPSRVMASDEGGKTYYFEDVVNAGKDTGYSENNEITKNDPHYGWKLGSFSISGYTQEIINTDGTVTFLKTVGDEVALSFQLNQNIDKLNDKDNLVIADDKNGYDLAFQSDRTDFGRGILIIQKTYQSNKEEPQVYIDYLAGVEVGANTKVDVFEEGDYTVSLDYEIQDKKLPIFSTYNDYKISFQFSVRNGNCMVFHFDVKTGDELTNESITKNGFRLDLARSRYLDINIKKEVLTESSGGLVEDVRFNGPAKEGKEYTEEGLYTITVKNNYTNQKTEKKIYVGTDKVMMAYVKTGYSIKDIKDLLKEGATIDDNGNIYIPPKSEESDKTENVSKLTVNSQNKISRSNVGGDTETEDDSLLLLPVITILILMAILILMISKKKKKRRLAKRNMNPKGQGENAPM